MQPGFDMNKLCKEAQTRWLKPVDVLFILSNHESFQVSNKPPDKPPSGSLFLFNRRILRNFRNDGHLWRKKNNRGTLAEAHEHLKVGDAEVLSCYYARGEQNPCFRRRIYWMLDPAYEHIVFVHYRDVAEMAKMHERGFHRSTIEWLYMAAALMHIANVYFCSKQEEYILNFVLVEVQYSFSLRGLNNSCLFDASKKDC